jgi:putative hydrolase of the HAD superfamily
MGRFKAVIFDLDDTLYPERQFVMGGLAAAARWIAGRTNRSPDGCRHELECLFDRGEKTQTFDAWLRKAGLPSSYMPAMVEAYREHVPSLTLYADAGEAIEHCHAGGLLTGLVSDGYLDVQRRKVAALGLSERLSTIVLSDEFGRAHWKPAPTPFLAAAERLGILPAEAVYVGDNPKKDFEGARRAGLKSVRVRRIDGVYASEEPVNRDAEPDREIATLRDLRDVLPSL